MTATTIQPASASISGARSACRKSAASVVGSGPRRSLRPRGARRVLPAALLLLCCAAAPTTRDGAAIAAKVSLRDPARGGRTVTVSLAYPAKLPGATTLPLVVLSHDADASPRSLEGLQRRLASAGYVTACAAHAGAPVARERGATAPPAEGEADELNDRAADLALVISQASGFGTVVPALKGHLDLTRIALVGHASGAYDIVALVTAAKPPDPRLRALVFLSPPRLGEQGLGPQTFKSLAVPTLFLSGTLDAARPGEKPDAKRRAFDQVPAHACLVTFRGATRLSYLGLSPAQRKFSDATADLSVSFLDAYVNGDDAKRDQWLSGSAVAPYTPFATFEGK